MTLSQCSNPQNKTESNNFAQKISQIIRVNQAGEYGAKLIYEGQRAELKKMTPLLNWLKK